MGLSITATNVISSINPAYGQGTAGAAITAGQLLYLDSATNTLKLADSDALASADSVGIALHGAGVGQPIKYQTAGDITIGATILAAEPYFNSPTPGAIEYYSNCTTGSYTKTVMMGRTTAIATIINMGPSTLVPKV